MSDSTRETRVYKAPPTEIYEVTADELELLDNSCHGLGQDLSFAIGSASIAVSFVIALSSADPRDTVRTVYVLVTLVFAVVFLYTGSKWWRARRTSPPIIERIRSRKMDPAS